MSVSYIASGEELQYDLYSSNNPIKSESYVVLYFTDRDPKIYKYPSKNGGSGGSWHYWNATDHPTARAADFITYIGPDSNVYECDQSSSW